MPQPLIDLVVGFTKTDEELKALDIPNEICKICATYVDIDIIEVAKEYPTCDYDIAFVFKARKENETTEYFGCESYEIIENDNNHNKIKFVKSDIKSAK